MGLIDKLTTNGSTFSYGNGVTPATNVGATSLSKLHANGEPGYSLGGANIGDVNPAYQSYNDGVTNVLPQPSQLDLNGLTPSRYTSNLPQ
jgi:hypothetical protein